MEIYLDVFIISTFFCDLIIWLDIYNDLILIREVKGRNNRKHVSNGYHIEIRKPSPPLFPSFILNQYYV